MREDVEGGLRRGGFVSAADLGFRARWGLGIYFLLPPGCRWQGLGLQGVLQWQGCVPGSRVSRSGIWLPAALVGMGMVFGRELGAGPEPLHT